MAMPARYRDALMSQCNGSLVATIDIQDKCLLIYPMPQWEKIEEQISTLPNFNTSTRRLQRLLIGHARELDMDGNGRILVPPELRAYAEIDKRTMLVGQGHRFELWSLDSWSSHRGSWLEEAASELSIPDEMQSLSL
jgi:MraZ protein